MFPVSTFITIEDGLGRGESLRLITYSHDSTIILVSIVVSLVAAFTGLALTNRIGSLPVPQRKALIVMSAFVLGGGIWSMHFVAMLAHRFDVPVHYDLLQTLGSALVAVLVVGLALLILHFAPRTQKVLTGAGLLLGAGIVAMHFIGMLGMRGVIPSFSSWSVIAAGLVAAVMGVMAIRVSYGTRTNKSIVLGGLWFGFSVVLVHFTAMAGTGFALDLSYVPASVVLDPDSLAIVVTVTAFVICGTFLLAAATFLTEPSVDTDTATPFVATAPGMPVSEPQTQSGLEVQGVPEVTESSSDERQQSSGVAGEQSPSPSVEVECSAASTDIEVPQPRTDSLGEAADGEALQLDSVETDGHVRIPFERNKHIEFVLGSEVAAIRADGRYTHLYTQEGVRFCPWSIAEAEKRLARESFFRSHRSYLVNLQKVDIFEKNRDAGLCRFDGYPQLGSVPVSRARVANLQQLLGL